MLSITAPGPNRSLFNSVRTDPDFTFTPAPAPAWVAGVEYRVVEFTQYSIMRQRPPSFLFLALRLRRVRLAGKGDGVRTPY